MALVCAEIQNTVSVFFFKVTVVNSSDKILVYPFWPIIVAEISCQACPQLSPEGRTVVRSSWVLDSGPKDATVGPNMESPGCSPRQDHHWLQVIVQLQNCKSTPTMGGGGGYPMCCLNKWLVL